MATIVTRSGKGSALSHTEMDANFTNLNTTKLERDGSVAATGDLPMGTNKITGMGDPGSAQDAATKAYADTKLANIVEDTTPQLGGNLDLNSNNITGAGLVDITNTTTGDALLITTTEDSSSAGPVITLKRNSSSPADADYLGQLKFKGENDADQEVVYAKITGKIDDASDTSEDGLIEFALQKAGSNNIGARLTSTELKLINGTGLEVAGLTYPTSDGSNGQVLTTNGSGTLSFAAASGGIANVVDDTSPQLGGTLDQNGQNITDNSRNFSLMSNVTDPTAHGFFSFASSGARAFGPAMVNVLTSNQSNRVYQNISAASAQLSADLSGSAQAGRIRQNFLEGNLVTDGFDLTTTGFGRGHHACWISAEVSNNHASNASTVTESTALSVIPQYEGSQSLTVTNGTGVAVQAFVDSANQTITNFIGYQYEHPAGTTTNFPASANHWSFKSTSSAAKLQNDGPAILSGLSYPTSDGTNGQFLKTNGSGTLSFATPTAFDGDLDGADLTDSGGDLTIKPSGATNAKLEVLNNGSDSITLKLGASSADATGTSFDAIDQTGARAKMTFSGKRMDFNSAGANINFITAAAAEPIRFLPANGESTTAELAITSNGSGTLSVLSDVNMIIGEDGGAQISMPSGNDRVAVNKMFEFASFTTTQRDAISSPNNGSVLYNSTTNKLQVYANGAWADLH